VEILNRKRRLLDTLKGTLCIDFADEESKQVTCNSGVDINSFSSRASDGDDCIGRRYGWVWMGVKEIGRAPEAGGPTS
jgi:hypothetical protein